MPGHGTRLSRGRHTQRYLSYGKSQTPNSTMSDTGVTQTVRAFARNRGEEQSGHTIHLQPFHFDTRPPGQGLDCTKSIPLSDLTLTPFKRHDPAVDEVSLVWAYTSRLLH